MTPSQANIKDQTSEIERIRNAIAKLYGELSQTLQDGIAADATREEVAELYAELKRIQEVHSFNMDRFYQALINGAGGEHLITELASVIRRG